MIVFPCMRTRAVTIAVTFLAALVGFTGQAQAQVTTSDQWASRSVLSARADSLDARLANPRLKGKDRGALVDQLSAVRGRLRDGDFQPGDRFLVTVVTDNSVTDSALVRESYAVSMGALPEASVRGVLRSELNAHLATHVAKYIRNATVRTQLFTRISIVGSVARPGYYYLPPDRPFSEIFVASGGPLPNAKTSGLQVRRNGRVVLSAKQAKRALESGSTLEQLDVRSGDEVRIPEKKRLNWQVVLQLLFIASSLLFAFISFLQWYYRDT